MLDKNLWQNVDVDVDYLNIFILRDWLKYSIDNLRLIFLSVSAILRSSFVKYMLKVKGWL